MTNDLDDWLATLAAAPADRPLDGLEADIGRDIAARRREARNVKALAPVRLAALSVSLVIGVSAGGAMAVTALRAPHPAGAFAAGADLAPSTLLEDIG